MVSEVSVPNLPISRLEPLIGSERLGLLKERSGQFETLVDGATIWNVNSTARGGGVAEMLQSLVGYTRNEGVDARWLVISGDSEFFAITKRIHNQLHGLPGDGGLLGAREIAHYESTMAKNLPGLLAVIQPGDFVLLHDPQTAGLARQIQEHGATVIWRCHIGTAFPNECTQQAWAFLRSFIIDCDAFVFSRLDYVPSWIDPENVTVIPPSIDPFSPKNQELRDTDVLRILATMGLITSNHDTPGEFIGYDGNRHVVNQTAEILREGGPLEASTSLVIQVSRWDQLKDMHGVMMGFVERVLPRSNAHLLLVGASVTDVTDDPEGTQVLAECTASWHALSEEQRKQISLVSLPMDDLDQNAAMVNAVQRHASVVVQKSLVEGFGITVTEALWKSKPVVASAVGGIQDQIAPGCGILLEDPLDLDAFGDAVALLLEDPNEMARLGANAHDYVLENYIGDKHLLRYVDLLTNLISSPRIARPRTSRKIVTHG